MKMSLPATTEIEGERSYCVIILVQRTSSTNLNVRLKSHIHRASVLIFGAIV